MLITMINLHVKKDNIFYHDDKLILNFLDGKCFSNDYERVK